MKTALRALFAVCALSAVTAHAFPEMIRHGYVNCTSCHFSPTGGGILTAYGRVQAEEVLSTWSKEGEGGVLHGLVGDTGPVSFGGQFRVLQMWKRDASFTTGRFIWMQNDLEAAVTAGPVTVVATAGIQDRADPFVSRRHYALWRTTETSPWTVRAGRFLYAYGINTPDHILATKRGIGLGEDTETYNVEFSYLAEHFDIFATAVLGFFNSGYDRGFALRGGWNLNDRSKIGVSFFAGDNGVRTRKLYGAYAMIGFTEHLFLLAQADLQNVVAGTGLGLGPAAYARVDYEFLKGLHGYASGEYSYLGGLTGYAAGLGVQWFPRPHFELRLHYDRRDDRNTGNVPAHYGWLMAHYYI
ncbi:hypothetical protein K2X33_01685 [bacterium]|nr:hypothetical protein [bacterium]